jgi:hypothetical protein
VSVTATSSGSLASDELPHYLLTYRFLVSGAHTRESVCESVAWQATLESLAACSDSGVLSRHCDVVPSDAQTGEARERFRAYAAEASGLVLP